MFYVYILHSKKDGGLYIGYTNDLRRRISEHKSGDCLSTRGRLPLKLIYYEAFSSKKDAKSREKYLKSGYGRDQLRNILKNTLDKTNEQE